MAEGFTVEFRTDHVHVELAADFTVERRPPEAFWNELRTICDQHGSRRVLVEGFLPTREHQTAEVVAAGQRTAMVPNLWLAFHMENFVPGDQSELYEVIAASQGVRVKYFADSEHALKWLRNNTPR